MTNDQQQYDLEGMLQAERKYSDSGQMTEMEVYAEYQVIKSRPLSPSPYAQPGSAIAPINYAQVAKGVGLFTSVCVVGYVGAMAVKIAVYAVLVWVEANALAIGGIFVLGCGLLLLVASFSGGESSTSRSNTGSGGQTIINNYYQSNSFGGDVNNNKS